MTSANPLAMLDAAMADLGSPPATATRGHPRDAVATAQTSVATVFINEIKDSGQSGHRGHQIAGIEADLLSDRCAWTPGTTGTGNGADPHTERAPKKAPSISVARVATVATPIENKEKYSGHHSIAGGYGVPAGGHSPAAASAMPTPLPTAMRPSANFDQIFEDYGLDGLSEADWGKATRIWLGLEPVEGWTMVI